MFRVLPTDPRLAGIRDRAMTDVREAAPWADVREVGSTAIPRCIGKGDLDVLVRAPSERFDATRAALDARFPRNPDQLSSEIYQGYTVPCPDGLDAALQLTVLGGPHDDFLPFLDALLADPTRVEAYNTLKRAWDGRPMDGYREAKSAFIARILRDVCSSRSFV